MPTRQTPDPEHSAAVLWGERQRPARGPKPGLSLEQIVAEAIQIADRDGLEALSMKRLAERLGAGTMSLYRYVSGKDDLIKLMFDAAIIAPDLPRSGDWRERVADCARLQREFFRAHPWAHSVVITRRPMGPRESQVLEAMLDALADTGLSGNEAMHTVMLLNGFVRGTAQFSDPANAPIDPAGYVRRFEREADYPSLMEVDSRMAPPSHQEEGFEYGLARIIDGVAARVER